MKYQQAKYDKVSKKDRRNSGRETTKIYHPDEEPYECVYWNDWNDHRDGYRSPDDNSQIRSEHSYWAEGLNIKKYNQKLKILLRRRKVMKNAHKDRYRK